MLRDQLDPFGELILLRAVLDLFDDQRAKDLALVLAFLFLFFPLLIVRRMLRPAERDDSDVFGVRLVHIVVHGRFELRRKIFRTAAKPERLARFDHPRSSLPKS